MGVGMSGYLKCPRCGNTADLQMESEDFNYDGRVYVEVTCGRCDDDETIDNSMFSAYSELKWEYD